VVGIPDTGLDEIMKQSLTQPPGKLAFILHGGHIIELPIREPVNAMHERRIELDIAIGILFFAF
jgi:hypothetical protein